MPEVRLITPITRQNTKKMQVAAYCRVSSNSADQLNSYAAQIRAYKKCIGARDDWELVDIFADEGLTGMKSETRDEFQRMIRMCELKQIDLIITKSISRFARNTKDALAYVRKLKLLGVGVQFEKEGISTLSMGDEMLLNTFSALAQEESQSISMNQRLSIVKRMELGEYVDSNAPYGYRLVDKALAVYEPEAAVVRDIFDLYLRGFSISEIGRELKSRNIPTKAGKESWHPYRIAYMLKNERYIGDSFYQKTYRETTVPFNQHINRGQEDRFYAKGTHPGIIDKDVFNAVQQLIQKRKETFSRTTTQNIYPLTSRIQCSECGSFYRRRSVSGTVKWVCALHKDDSTACDSHYYSEERIYDGFITMVNKLRFSEDNILGQVISRLEMTLAAMKRNNLVARDLSNSIAELNAKLLMLEQLRSKGYLAPEVYQAQANELSQKLWAIANELRGQMDASEFKNYILGVIFYRYLSERTEMYMAEILKNDGVTYEEAFKDDEYRPVVEEWSLSKLGYVIKPENLFRNLIRKITKFDNDADKFSVEDFEKAINDLVGSTMGYESNKAFDGLFNDMRLQDARLGETVADRTDMIGRVMVKVSDIDFDLQDSQFDVLGTAYMILIGLFASDAGKKGGEFFTPVGPSRLCATLASLGLDEAKTVGDCTCGSASMLLEV